MDNMTHSLVGLALGELVDRALPAPADPSRGRLRRRLLLATGLLASNFPDLDLVLTPLLPAPLGYLIHHRGHTHTLLYALPQVALLLALLWLLPSPASSSRRPPPCLPLLPKPARTTHGRSSCCHRSSKPISTERRLRGLKGRLLS